MSSSGRRSSSRCVRRFVGISSKAVALISTPFQYDLTQPDLTVVWLHYGELMRATTSFPFPDSFESLFHENVDDIISCLGIALCMLRHELRVELEDSPARQRHLPVDHTKINVRLHGVTPVLPIAALKADVVNQFVSITGTVVRVSAIKPLVRRCEFVCANCNEVTPRAFPDGNYTAPLKCDHSPCRSRTLLPNRSTVETVDYQKIKCVEIRIGCSPLTVANQR
jgi:DNA replicative helicase MCM subunit Mcm2 (Cdc46/Mcm family)